MAAGNIDVLQEVLKFTTETTKQKDGSVSRTVEDEDMQWLKEALASLGDEEAKRLTEVHEVLIHATERPVDDIVEAVDFMCDFVDTYDSAKDWIESGGADLVQHLFVNGATEVTAATMRLLVALSQNHIPVQKLLHSHAVWPTLLQFLMSAVASMASEYVFEPPVQVLLQAALDTRSASTPASQGQASAAPFKAAPGQEHEAWQSHNKAAVVRAQMDELLDIPGDAEAGLAVAAAWRPAEAQQLLPLISALGSVIRSADTLESDFVECGGAGALAALLSSSKCLPSTPVGRRLHRKGMLLLRALLQSKACRKQALPGIVGVEGFASATACAVQQAAEPSDAAADAPTDPTLLEHAGVVAAVLLNSAAVAAARGSPPSAGILELAGAVQAAAAAVGSDFAASLKMAAAAASGFTSPAA